jgi:hypothetical protein
VKSVRLNHLRAALLAVAAAGLLAAVGVFIVVLYTQPAGATFPGKPAKIAYYGYDGNDNEIYKINSGGGGKVQLTDNSTGDYEPNYSPSGKKIGLTPLRWTHLCHAASSSSSLTSSNSAGLKYPKAECLLRVL